MKSFLLIGASGSGKSYYAKELAKQFTTVYVVNGDDDFKSCTRITYEEVKDRVTSDSLLIFDDVVSPSNV